MGDFLTQDIKALGKMKSHTPVSSDESSLRSKCPSKEYSEAGFRGPFQTVSGKGSCGIVSGDGVSWCILKARQVCLTSRHDGLTQGSVLWARHPHTFLCSSYDNNNNKSDWLKGTEFPLNAFILGSVYNIRKMVIHSTDTRKEVCWVYSGGG